VTAQIPDRLDYEGHEFSIVGIKGEGLAHPLDFGMQPTTIHTGCYRGYYSTYSCVNGKLKLISLTLRTADGTYIAIHDVRPELDRITNRDGKEVTANATYSGLEIDVAFSGGLLVARDFIQEMYVHMGFQKPYAYERVIEMMFRNGQLVGQIDHSDRMAFIRQEVISGEERKPGSFNRDEMKDWIEWTFSLDYD